MNVEYSLLWDDPTLHDKVTEMEGLPIHIDHETMNHLDTPSLTIDYRENQGYKLTSPVQIVAYALKIKDRWE